MSIFAYEVLIVCATPDKNTSNTLQQDPKLRQRVRLAKHVHISSDVNLAFTLVNNSSHTHYVCYTGCSRKTAQILMHHNFTIVSHTVTWLSSKCPQSTSKHKNGNGWTIQLDMFCVATGKLLNTPIPTTLLMRLMMEIKFATNTHDSINKNDVLCVDPANERPTTGI